jgi:hypothetical protein
MGVYPKVKTQFDGLAFEDSVTYLTMRAQDSAKLRLAPNRALNTALDFTVKFWFKVDHLNATENVQLVHFHGSVYCYFMSDSAIMCDTPERQRLIAEVGHFEPGKWYYFSLAVTEAGSSTLTIWDKLGALATDHSEYFFFKQTQKMFFACLGKCDPDYTGIEDGFKGGLREFLALSEHQDQKTIFENANSYQNYNFKVKGYYRFSAHKPELFAVEEFRLRHAKLNTDAQWRVGKDLIASDICPTTLETARVVRIDKNQYIDDVDIDKTFRQTQYAYTMTLSLYIDPETCYTRDLSDAEEACSIIHLENVFMLFFSSNSLARFHFYAEKNYYESQSSPFFLPYNQWITIQMQMTQYQGYQIVVLDEEGEVLVNFAKQMNMQKQLPGNELNMFTGLVGYAGKFVLIDKAYYLPQISRRFEDEALINVSFINAFTRQIKNEALGPDVVFKNPTKLDTVPYALSEYLQPFPPKPQFDGVACDDDHTSMRLLNENSYIMFDTPTNQDWMSETSINFWFRLNDWSKVENNAESQTFTMFMMESPDRFENYWQVYVRSGDLVVAPFGQAKQTDPAMVWEDFNQDMEDEVGWFHLSCYYHFYAKAECTLYNKKISNTKVVSL